MSQTGCKSIIFSSSASVYGVPSILPITEACSLSTTNPYAETKIVIENLLQDMFISDSDWNISILRYFNPVGAHQSGLIGESLSGVPSNLFPYVSKVAKGDVAQCYADASLAFKLLNWKTELNLSQMCQDTWNWEKFNRSL